LDAPASASVNFTTVSTTFLVSSNAQARIDALRAQLQRFEPHEAVVLLAPSYEVGSECLRDLKRTTFGLQRSTLFRYAAELAASALAERGLIMATPLALDALWARVVFKLERLKLLGRLTPIADKPGLRAALQETVGELRMKQIAVDSLSIELREACALYEAELQRAQLADRTQVFQLAAHVKKPALAGLMLFDVALAFDVRNAFVSTLLANITWACAPVRDRESVLALQESLGILPRQIEGQPTTLVGQLQRRLFVNSAPDATTNGTLEGTGLSPSDSHAVQNPAWPVQTSEAARRNQGAVQNPAWPVQTSEAARRNQGAVQNPAWPVQTSEAARRNQGAESAPEFFSAPGEARETVEIVRRVLACARSGVAFDDMAVLLHSPELYARPLADAFRRAGVPAWFEADVPIPEASGRAFLALLLCAEEEFSARRFAEYLSLSQVPRVNIERDGEPLTPFAPSNAETLLSDAEADLPDTLVDSAASDSRIPEGTLRAPHRWEKLIVEASVIGSADRFERRLKGLLALKETELQHADDSQSPRLSREVDELHSLIAFVIPVIGELASWPREDDWGTWLRLLKSFAVKILRRPERVLAILQELSPMSEVGPVSLTEVRTVLAPRLSFATEVSPKRRYGQVCIAPIEAARGRSFSVVFVPGVAERLFPKKIQEDPLLPDAARKQISSHLVTNENRSARQRLALELAVGAAQTKVVFSYPRIDGSSARPRVPSFYLLDAILALEGRLPNIGELLQRTENQGAVRLAWPAPLDPQVSIDDAEFDLAMLALALAQPTEARGKMRYLVEVSRTASRALRTRYARWQQSRLTAADGLVRPGAQARALLEKHQFSARAFSPTALEYFATCPYKFYLHALQRFSPLEVVEEIEELGPLERGLMAHQIQYQLLTHLRETSTEVVPATLDTALAHLDEILNAVSAHYADEFRPAIERVWLDGRESLRADLREWLRRLSLDTQWKPWRFELSFGLGARGQQDAASIPECVEIQQGLKLRGSIDLIEQGIRGTIRATDYKTGKVRASSSNVVGGGKHLQPMLYASVLEKIVPQQPVESGRLYYCSQTGGFSEVHTMLSQENKNILAQAILGVRGALEEGFFPAAPSAGECHFCPYISVCGPEEERRLRRSHKDKSLELRSLQNIRRLP
jgi:ATP-dependent helicase/nuclease subunit B